MALKQIKGMVSTVTRRIKDAFNNDVRWQHTNGENATDATLYVDGEGFSLYVGGDGDVHVELLDGDGSTVIYYGVVAGTFMPIVARRLLAATTATNIVVSR